MFGIDFDGFDDGTGLGLRPLLLPEGFEGTPLRKSFVLAARVARPWPGAKEPGEAATPTAAARARRAGAQTRAARRARPVVGAATPRGPAPMTRSSRSSCALVAVLAAFLVLPLLVGQTEHKVMAHMQGRLGPMYAGGFHGWAQLVADGVKFVQKEDIVPAAADRRVFKLAPGRALVPYLVALAAIPLSPGRGRRRRRRRRCSSSLAVTGVGVLGTLMAGWASANKYSLLGGLRAAAQLLAYELPIVLAAASVAHGRRHAVADRHRRARGSGGGCSGSCPAPSCFLVAGAGRAAAAAVRHAGRRLRDRLRPLHRVHRAAVRVLPARPSTPASWSCRCCSPCCSSAAGRARSPTSARLAVDAGSRRSAVAVVVVWLRVAWPRLREDQLQRLAWLVLVPLALAQLALTGVVVVVDRMTDDARATRPARRGLPGLVKGLRHHRAHAGHAEPHRRVPRRRSRTCRRAAAGSSRCSRRTARLHAVRPRVPRLVHLHRLAQGDDAGHDRGRPRAAAQRARPVRHRLLALHVLRHLHRGLPVRRPALEPGVRVRRARHPRPAAREGPARPVDAHRPAAAGAGPGAAEPAEVAAANQPTRAPARAARTRRAADAPAGRARPAAAAGPAAPRAEPPATRPVPGRHRGRAHDDAGRRLHRGRRWSPPRAPSSP